MRQEFYLLCVFHFLYTRCQTSEPKYVNNGILLVPGVGDAVVPECASGPISLPRTRLWASLLQALPPEGHQRCWAAKMQLMWDMPPGCNTTGLLLRSTAVQDSECEPVYVPKRGVHIDVETPGTTQGLDYLDYIENIGLYGTKYFHDLLTQLRQLGYRDGDTLLGYPYDWRYPFWQLDYDGMKDVIEDFVRRYPKKKVTIIAHSLGSLIVNRFLTQVVDSAWKQKYIGGFVSIAGAFGGSHKTIRSLLSGYPEATMIDLFGVTNISLVSAPIVRSLHRTFGSMYSLLPNVQVFPSVAPVIEVIATAAAPTSTNTWMFFGCPLDTAVLSCLYSQLTQNAKLMRESTPIVMIQKYTLNNWWTLLPSALQPLASQARHRLEKEPMLEDPQVPVYCFWSVFDVPTTEVAYTYTTTDVETTSPTFRLTYGDNTLTAESASYCRHWPSTVVSRQLRNLVGQPSRVLLHLCAIQDHVGILYDQEFMTYLASLISGAPSLYSVE